MSIYLPHFWAQSMYTIEYKGSKVPTPLTFGLDLPIYQLYLSALARAPLSPHIRLETREQLQAHCLSGCQDLNIAGNSNL